MYLHLLRTEQTLRSGHVGHQGASVGEGVIKREKGGAVMRGLGGKFR